MPGVAGRLDGGLLWPAYWVSALRPARGVKGGSFPPVSAVGVAVGLGGLGVKVLEPGAAALVVVARCSWVEIVPRCCPAATAVWAAW